MLAVEQDSNDEIRRTICEIVAVVARNLIVDGNNQWTEILGFLFRWADSTNVQLQESALRIYTRVPNIFVILESQHKESIRQKLKELGRSSSVEVRTQAAYAFHRHKHNADDANDEDDEDDPLFFLQILTSNSQETPGRLEQISELLFGGMVPRDSPGGQSTSSEGQGSGHSPDLGSIHSFNELEPDNGLFVITPPPANSSNASTNRYISLYKKVLVKSFKRNKQTFF